MFGAALLLAALSLAQPPSMAAARADRDVIRRTISSSMGRIAYCADASARRTSLFPRKLMLRFLVHPNGKPAAVEIEHASKDPLYDACLLRVFSSLRFRGLKTKRSLQVGYPLLLCGT